MHNTDYSQKNMSTSKKNYRRRLVRMPGHTSRQLACVCAIVNVGFCTTQQTNINSIQRGARNDPAFLKEGKGIIRERS